MLGAIRDAQILCFGALQRNGYRDCRRLCKGRSSGVETGIKDFTRKNRRQGELQAKGTAWDSFGKQNNIF